MPDFDAQFRSPPDPYAKIYMGGTTVSCGEHPTLPKRHRWGPWRVFVMRNPAYIGRERMCKTCGLMSDTETKLRRGEGSAKW